MIIELIIAIVFLITAYPTGLLLKKLTYDEEKSRNYHFRNLGFLSLMIIIVLLLLQVILYHDLIALIFSLTYLFFVFRIGIS